MKICWLFRLLHFQTSMIFWDILKYTLLANFNQSSKWWQNKNIAIKFQFSEVVCVSETLSVCVHMSCWLLQRLFLVLVGQQVHVVLAEPLAWDLIKESWCIPTLRWWHQLKEKRFKGQCWVSITWINKK